MRYLRIPLFYTMPAPCHHRLASLYRTTHEYQDSETFTANFSSADLILRACNEINKGFLEVLYVRLLFHSQLSIRTARMLEPITFEYEKWNGLIDVHLMTILSSGMKTDTSSRTVLRIIFERWCFLFLDGNRNEGAKIDSKLFFYIFAYARSSRVCGREGRVEWWWYTKK